MSERLHTVEHQEGDRDDKATAAIDEILQAFVKYTHQTSGAAKQEEANAYIGTSKLAGFIAIAKTLSPNDPNIHRYVTLAVDVTPDDMLRATITLLRGVVQRNEENNSTLHDLVKDAMGMQLIPKTDKNVN